MKDILMLLKKLDLKEDFEHIIQFYSDGYGRVLKDDKKVFSFKSEKGLKSQLIKRTK